MVNFIHPTLPLTFGRDTKSVWSLLSGVQARGSKDPTQGNGSPVWDSLICVNLNCYLLAVWCLHQGKQKIQYIEMENLPWMHRAGISFSQPSCVRIIKNTSGGINVDICFIKRDKSSECRVKTNRNKGNG